MPSPLQHVHGRNKVEQEDQEAIQEFYSWYALQHSEIRVGNDERTRLLPKQGLMNVVVVDISHDNDLVAHESSHFFWWIRQCFTEIPDQHFTIVDVRLSNRQVYDKRIDPPT